MLNKFIYETAEPVRLLQLTDPHLFKEPTGELLGINTLASFKQVLTEIQLSDFDPDFILATGDIVQDSSDEGYLTFCQQMKQLKKQVFWLPGNHDFQPKMFEFLTQQNGVMNPIKHILAGKHWQVLLLDSQVYGVPHGRLTQYQIDWLLAKLRDHPLRYTLVVLHHHILSTGSAWLDQHNLRNANELADALAPFRNVKGILHGHIHQQVDDEWCGYQIMSTPSTCVQFKPDCNTFTLDTLQPGWREIVLYNDGTIKTAVKRIQNAVFLPNMQEEGY